MLRLPRWLIRFDRGVIGITRRYSLLILRIALGIVFIWFGALKVFDASPVAGLVAETLPFLSPRVAVLCLGAVEVIIGLGLLTGWAIRVTLLLFFAQMAGTFLIAAVRPGLIFVDGNPLLLTVLGEFLLKNVVLIAGGLAIVATVPRVAGDEGPRQMLKGKARPAIPPPSDG